MTFDEPVEVNTTSGTPRIALDTGQAGAHASYQTGSGTTELLFRYVVAPVDESDDLGYAGESALSLNGGTIKDDAGNPANLALPARGSPGSLSGSAAISVDHVEPPLIAQDSVDKDDHGGLPLDMAQGADAFAMGNATYVIATSPSAAAVQLLRVHGDGTLSPAGNATDGGGLLLEGASDVAALRIGNDTFAVVSAAAESAVQLLRVHEDGTLSPAGSATDGGDFRLGAPSGVDAFVTGDGRAYAAVASLAHNEIQVVRIHGDSGTLSAGPGMSAGVAGTSPGAWYVDAFAVGDRTYALVTATHDNDGVQLFRVHDDGRLELSASATDDIGGFDALNGSRGVDTFVMGNDTYAIVVSEHDGGGAAQLIRVHYDGTLEAAGSAFNGTGGFDALGGARAVSVFNGTYGDPYAIVTSQAGGAVQLVHIHDDGTLLPAGSAADGMPGPGGNIFDALGEPHDVAAFYLDGRAYAAVASRSDGGVQLIRLSPASATGASISPAGGVYGPGAELAIEVAFDGRVNVTGRPELPLNSGGVAVYESGSNSSTLVFSYTVKRGEAAEPLDYHEDEYALYGPGEIVEAGIGVDADRTLPAPGSPGSLSGSSSIKIDGIAPRVAGVTSGSPDGAYGEGRTVNVSVSFTEPASYSGSAPELLLNVSGRPAPAAYASGNGTATFVFAYTVRAGDSSDGLAYWNATALSGQIADAAGNPADLALPAPGSPGSLSASSSVSVDGFATAAVTAYAAFTGPNTVRIDYSAPLGPPAGHEGPVYGAVTVEGAAPARPVPGGVSGLGTAVHAVRFGGGGVDASQSGSIDLGVALGGREGSTRYAFPAGAIPVRAGEDARTLAPPGTMPVVAIERDGFVRAVNATGAGGAARLAIDVSGLSNATLSADASLNTVRFPAEGVNLTASFAEVMIPPNATARGVPADGRLDLYISEQGPTARQVADALGATGDVVVPLMVEIGDNATHIGFDPLPVRILLRGQANGTAFYVNSTDRAAVPILTMCSEDDTAAVHEQLDGTGIDECWLDSGADKVIHTHHLTLFGTAMAPGGGPPFVPACSIELGPQQQEQPPPIEFGSIREGGRSAADKTQEVRKTGTLPIDTVTIRATAWTDASDAIVMPANATSVMAGARGWVALDGEVDLPGSAEGATAKFRVDVPAGALPEGAPAAGVAASQTVTYTATCDARPG